MSTVTFRLDYAKFMFDVSAEEWNHRYRVVCESSHERKYKGEFLKSHKTNRLWFDAKTGRERWTLELWGEWAGLAELLPSHWIEDLKRVDVRAIVWDANVDTVLDLGQHLQRNISNWNINVYNTKPATKRLGRDRGGVGFAIGSHKSDLRVTTYKRTGEPVAQEFQCSGAMLTRIIARLHADFNFMNPTVDYYKLLNKAIQVEGNRRLTRVLEAAGIGTYWPVIGAEDLPALPPTQAAFIAELQDIIDEHTDELGEEV